MFINLVFWGIVVQEEVTARRVEEVSSAVQGKASIGGRIEVVPFPVQRDIIVMGNVSPAWDKVVNKDGRVGSVSEPHILVPYEEVTLPGDHHMTKTL
ncbi:Hypothetical predicted protein [Prunus dulcis]|uniref:Uncharacterized protein n=1 Tax=Prunus dulcis TaxID=3755 RepID=A0A5E4FR24_PRUDU|nr:Hypothetical predicted protein [Prunus dulcis]